MTLYFKCNYLQVRKRFSVGFSLFICWNNPWAPTLYKNTGDFLPRYASPLVGTPLYSIAYIVWCVFGFTSAHITLGSVVNNGLKCLIWLSLLQLAALVKYQSCMPDREEGQSDNNQSTKTPKHQNSSTSMEPKWKHPQNTHLGLLMQMQRVRWGGGTWHT